MNNQDMKIYFDGSHYIGIPKGAFPSKKGRKRCVVKTVQQPQKEQTVDTPPETTKERFEKAYKDSQSLPKKERKTHIKEALKEDFAENDELAVFVDKHVERMKTNAIKRKVRLMRKLRLQDWDFFCTFTYSDELHTEESFCKKLSNTLKHLVARTGWKYVGVWERGNDTNRLHFHGIFYIPDSKMIGKLEEVKDYDTRNHRMQTTYQNTHFLKQFGRNDFKDIATQDDISEALMRSAIRNLRAAIQNPQDYTARSNLMWAATMAENRVIKLGKRMDFECHQMEHQLGAYTNCNHGEGLAVLHPVYYRHIYKYGLPKFKRFATEVMGVSAEAKTDEEIALAGIEALEDFIIEIGLPVSLQDLGVNENTDLKEIADSCALMPGSYKKMTHEEILGIFKECY